ncbi:hypothetical protein LEP1GSC161_1395 [Leptospira santarosai str. CBC1416]|uniref:Uncharacterized protein n=1 Tax=Leptospira santarosai str. CBC1416 TaxID=1193059 RepID=M6VVW6_9LEPT|nr:hypothetical protein LEP1GSC161_1395 [Leptospira santarosai str. CBC1416]
MRIKRISIWNQLESGKEFFPIFSFLEIVFVVEEDWLSNFASSDRKDELILQERRLCDRAEFSDFFPAN